MGNYEELDFCCLIVCEGFHPWTFIVSSFSIGVIFGIIRVYTVLFSDPWMLLFEFCGIKCHLKDTSLLFNNRIYSGLHRFISPLI